MTGGAVVRRVEPPVEGTGEGGLAACQVGRGEGVVPGDEGRKAGSAVLSLIDGDPLLIAARLSLGISVSSGGGIEVRVQGDRASTTSRGL